MAPIQVDAAVAFKTEPSSGTVYACWLAKCYMTLNMGYPFFSRHFVAALRHRRPPKSAAERAELREWQMTHSSSIGYVRSLLVISSALFFAQMMILPVTFFHGGAGGLATRRKDSSGEPSDEFQFGCLVNNCSSAQVDQATMVESLSQLALSLCHGRLSFWHSAAHHMGVQGVLLATVLGFIVLLTGAILPLILRLRPTGNMLVMFLVAPHVTRHIVQDRAAELLDELQYSFENYTRTRLLHHQAARVAATGSTARQRHLTVEERPPHRGTRSLKTLASLHPGDEGERRRRDKHGAPMKADFSFGNDPKDTANCTIEREDFKRLSDASPRHEARRQFCALFARDCVTIMRSAWWHSKATSAFGHINEATMSNLVFMLILVAFGLHKLVTLSQEAMSQFASKLVEWRCNIWLASGHGGGNETALGDDADVLTTSEDNIQPLDQFHIQVNVAVWLVNTLQCVWLCICMNCYLLVYFFTNAELICWLHELILGLTFGLEFVKQLRLDASQPAKSPSETESHYESAPAAHFKDLRTNGSLQQHFSMELLRNKTGDLINLRTFIVFDKLPGRRAGGTNSKLESALAVEQFVASNIQLHRLSSEAAAELLEKLYINFRIFVEQVNYYGPMMSTLMEWINIYIYTFVLIGIYFLRSVENFVLLPTLLILIGGFSANFFILFASNLHAKARGVHSLIWSLVAATSQCEDIRTQHMHKLWLKQVSALDMDDGLALRVHKLRITYAKIGQLMIASGTLVVFMLRI